MKTETKREQIMGGEREREKEGACGVCTHCSDSILRLCVFP